MYWLLQRLRQFFHWCWRWKLIRYGVRTFSGLVLLFFLLNLLFPLKVQIRYSTLLTDQHGEVINAFLSPDDKWRMKTELREISPTLRKIIIYKEDKSFYHHPGVNPLALVRAAVGNLFHWKKNSGASTITMQVARMLEPKKRNLFSKLIEIFRAFQLELRFSKEEILQLYLNLVPYGGNIEGVKSAAVLYYGQQPDKLSLAQLTALAIIPNRPTSLRIGYKSSALRKARDQWLRQFRRDHLFPDQEISDALQEPLSDLRQDPPKEAPQLALRLKKQYPGVPIIHASVSKMMQSRAQDIVYHYIQRLMPLHITNAAVLVIDNRTKKVLAYVGSADFNDQADQGQVDGIRGIRSPGSAMKPFLYACAFDKGLLTPKTVLEDVPLNINGYKPENYDRKFRGKVTVEDALSASLNIPAVKTLNRYGIRNFSDKLVEACFQQVKKEQDKLGLAMILGGCGVTLEEMANLYSIFPNGGQWSSLCWLSSDKKSGMRSLVSPESAFMISEILTRLTRPDLPNNFESSYHLPRIAWKTGTSYGRRDAWSIGFNKDYTVGVWVGNFNGEGVPELVGADMASPLLFDVFNAIDYNAPNDWLQAPPGLGFRLVCPESGLPPADFCEHTVMDYYIPTVSSNQVCNHLKEVFVSPDESISYCTACLPQSGYKKKWYDNISPELLAFYQEQNIPYTAIPPHNPACSRVLTENAPQINTLNDGAEYYIEQKEGQQLALGCTAQNEVGKVFWYVNDKLVGTCKPSGKLFFNPAQGHLKISCTDDKGRNTDIQITVFWMD